MALSREAKIYLALWRRAETSGEPVVIKAPNLHSGISMRQGMYRAMKSFRGRRDIDETLAAAGDNFVITLTPGPTPQSPAQIAFTPRKTLSILEAQLLDLGLEESDIIEPQDLKISKSLSDLLAASKAETPAPTSTPFYTRED